MEYKSDLNTVITNILGKLSGEKLDAMQTEIATTLQASNLRRIHTDGLNVRLTRIGRYSLSPGLYVNPKNSPVKFQPIGKGGEGTTAKSSRLVFSVKSHAAKTVTTKGGQYFKNGKPHKTGYFKSYQSFRSAIGRYANFVNLQLTGGLKSAFKIRRLGSGIAIGFWTGKYAERAVRLEEHFGGTDIWGVTTEDKKTVDLIIDKHLKTAA